MKAAAVIPLKADTIPLRDVPEPAPNDRNERGFPWRSSS
jgi:hypothetical protein